MASRSSRNYRERTHTRDPVIIQDYGQFLNSATASLLLPTDRRRETEFSRVQVTYELFQAVVVAKYVGDTPGSPLSGDFSTFGGTSLARGGFFQTRRCPGKGIAKYPLIPDDTGILPKSAYVSLLKELQILSHAPLKEHDNIVRLISVQWARIDPVAHSWIPVLLLEEAQHGSLQQYVASEKPDIETYLQLSQEIGSGLQALHASGIIHGDLKFQNILVFSLEDGRVRAKLSDFGSSVIRNQDDLTVTFTAGTPPWTSPEYGEPVQSDLACGTDTYSYGLLVWRLCLRGQSPFDGQDSQDIWRRKKSDLILGEAAVSLEEGYQKTMLLSGHAASGTRFQLYELAVSIPRRCLQYCLSVSIENRDLDKAVEALHYGSHTYVDFRRVLPTSRKVPLRKLLTNIRFLGGLPNPKKNGGGEGKQSFAGGQLVVSHIRLFNVHRSVRAMFHQCVTEITENPNIVDRITAMGCLFELSLQTFDAFGQTKRSMASAVSLMRDAAMAGEPAAQVMMGQFYEASGVVMDAAIRSEYETLLARGVENGSLIGRIWLRRYNHEALRKAEQFQAYEVAGVPLGKGMDSRSPPGDVIDKAFGEDSFASISRLLGDGRTENLWLSQRKNSHLHTGAAFGINPDRFRAFLGLLRGFIDCKDKDGNTALLLAVRFARIEIAKILLENGADPSLANNQGETPWHWLVAIQNLEDIIDLAKLLQRGGKSVLDATAECSNSWTDMFGISDGGTALHWAVQLGMTGLARTLVSCGADIQHAFKGIRPVDIAIRRNKPEILRVFFEELRRRGETLAPPVLPFMLSRTGKSISVSTWPQNYIVQAIDSYPFHQRLAHGGKGWVDALKHTLFILREFDLVPKVPISALPQLLTSTGDDTIILKILSEGNFLETGSDQAKFWADVAEIIIQSADTSNVLYAMKRAKTYSADGRIPNAEDLLELCTEGDACDGILVDVIASEGIRVDFPTQLSRTPLMGAILYRNFEIASALIRHGADVNAMWKPIYAIQADVEHPDVNILYEHLTSNSDTALAPLRYLLEPLHSQKDLVPSFIVIPSEKKTALHLACADGNPLIVGYLLSKFNTPYHLDFVDNQGLTALHFAASFGHVDIARKLCEKGARVDILSGDRGNALDCCYSQLSPDMSDLQEFHGIVQDLEDVFLGRLEISKILVRERQAVRTADLEDDCCMVWSFELCYYAVWRDMSRLLKAALQDLRNDPESSIPWQDALDRLLSFAALRSRADSAKLLLDYSANVNKVVCIHENLTLLHRVVANGDAEMAYLLLQAGAEVNAVDKTGETPLTYGLMCQDLPTCQVLCHFGGITTLDESCIARLAANMNWCLNDGDTKSEDDEEDGEDWDTSEDEE
ncbi:hypothetical protein LCI18_002958 [Fusarium solani-melongenae]|uniref:Uncharacterized protein n=1 Tax=Fusarium solani subsp. cucurbitae TaxID=2747967 RepID=A0ACD3YT46_FUSSC|nr:hypothetical protein LCI18_002958 [Fusarium solani-melongenae]